MKKKWNQFSARPVRINSGRRVAAVFASNDQAASHTLPCSHEEIYLSNTRLDKKKHYAWYYNKTAFMPIIEYHLPPHTHTPKPPSSTLVHKQKTEPIFKTGQTVLNPEKFTKNFYAFMFRGISNTVRYQNSECQNKVLFITFDKSIKSTVLCA